MERRLALALLLLTAGAGLAVATETEVREFTLFVNNKHAGQSTISITRADDGTETMSAQVNLKVKHILGTYTYSYQGTEVWRGGRLLQLASQCNDDGKMFEVQANAEGDQIKVRVKGQERRLRGDVWTASYWKLPDARFYNQTVPVLDPDNGMDMNGRLEYVGISQVQIGGKAQNCYHFRVTGVPNTTELWYDGALRLVRQEFTEKGHRITVHLTGLRR
jgi:hypothetical protein